MHEQRETWAGLKAGNCQVLLCDLQEQIVARSKTTAPDALAQSAEVLAKIAALYEVPMTFSVVPEQEEAPRLLPGLRPFAREDNQFLRSNASPFLEPKTREHLASLDRKTLLIVGFATEVVVLHAAVHALEAGYRVIVPVDTCGGSSERTDRAALAQIREFGGVLSSVLSIATALGPEFAAGKGKQGFAIVQTLRLA